MTSIVEEIIGLDKLRRKGIITDEEFKKGKEKILYINKDLKKRKLEEVKTSNTKEVKKENSNKDIKEIKKEPNKVKTQIKTEVSNLEKKSKQIKEQGKKKIESINKKIPESIKKEKKSFKPLRKISSFLIIVACLGFLMNHLEKTSSFSEKELTKKALRKWKNEQAFDKTKNEISNTLTSFDEKLMPNWNDFLKSLDEGDITVVQEKAEINYKEAKATLKEVKNIEWTKTGDSEFDGEVERLKDSAVIAYSLKRDAIKSIIKASESKDPKKTAEASKKINEFSSYWEDFQLKAKALTEKEKNRV